ncbi:delta-aminolevulinic acid dehydratase [candidate division MSBL1 archaeon SCGC-AAA259A05]|uniref:Delta-aminolevulinic acid dehydratase n=1 Tax=candidate division MSBL1 archaeon SCGC-AAA259A05 TaxID=1698259 RepID=A0A133UBZ7_9EURY|nr:delta-aminolevulinic acid dehydratase [candidate division MSBL1 archaeon SCGC-AAA259A05]
MRFPKTRLRRLRKGKNVRRLTRDVSLSKDDFLYPIFVKEGIEEKREIEGLPGQFHYPLDGLEEVLSECEELGIPGALLFGIPREKDEKGSEAFDSEGIVQRAGKKIKKSSKLTLFTDTCLCQYTSHGHCGVLSDEGLDNDESLKILKKVAISQAEAGADYVSPSAMLDGQVKSIREGLDKEGYGSVGIMSYSAKFNSSFYGPFRAAAESAPKKIEGPSKLDGRKTYQMSYRASDQPLREISLDIKEGADIVMVKPALPYLDIIKRASESFDIPISAYQVSGEYAMIKETSRSGLIDERDAFLESLVSIKRSGANFIITYAALDVARWLDES